jgi:hypothetical protein
MTRRFGRTGTGGSRPRPKQKLCVLRLANASHSRLEAFVPRHARGRMPAPTFQFRERHTAFTATSGIFEWTMRLISSVYLPARIRRNSRSMVQIRSRAEAASACTFGAVIIVQHDFVGRLRHPRPADSLLFVCSEPPCVLARWPVQRLFGRTSAGSVWRNSGTPPVHTPVSSQARQTGQRDRQAARLVAPGLQRMVWELLGTIVYTRIQQSRTELPSLHQQSRLSRSSLS